MSLAHEMCLHMIKSLMHANLFVYCIVKDLTKMAAPWGAKIRRRKNTSANKDIDKEYSFIGCFSSLKHTAHYNYMNA